MQYGLDSEVGREMRAAHKLVEVQLLKDVPALGRQGDIVIVAPGRARNTLIPRGLGLYIAGGKAVSPLRSMLDRQAQIAISRQAQDKIITARDVVDSLSNNNEPELQSSEQAILAALSLLPQPLTFKRRTHASDELFGSVSVQDVLANVRDFGLRLDEAACSFVESAGIEKGRIKRIGDYIFEIQVKGTDKTQLIDVKVVAE
ncbi:hypothetical protein OIV83_003646 [Microbotryomycetes sp. JL201]|nr:hypothetical protein OIV83_003646 [Microbotryomycetes sp. JL201]